MINITSTQEYEYKLGDEVIVVTLHEGNPEKLRKGHPYIVTGASPVLNETGEGFYVVYALNHKYTNESVFTTSDVFIPRTYSGITHEEMEDVDPPTFIDYVNEPPHYQLPDGIQVIDIIEYVTNRDSDPKTAYHVGNAIKYLLRFPDKGQIQDLEKCVWYLTRAIEIKKGER